MRQIILDTETTGLSAQAGHRIIEIGCVELINRRLTGDHLHFYINPNRSIDAGAKAIHGITEDFLKDKPRFHDIADTLINYIDNAELIIHNAPFDISFLDAELARLEKKYRTINSYCQVLDTLALARRKHPGQQNNLDALCKRYQVDYSGRDLHGALLDARLLAQVYLLMTGGQSQLFDSELEATEAMNNLTTAQSITKNRKKDLPIFYATDAENIEHHAYLEKMHDEVQ